jgi:4-hydroxy-tetrahydrodipicolinate synthase
MLYDIPIRSGRKIETETILKLVNDIDNIVALKDAAGDPSETARLLSEAPDELEVYSGDDSLNLALLSIGVSGVVGVATHWSGVEHQNLVNAIVEGDYIKAKTINQSLQSSFAFESSLDAPNPIPTKVMMNLIGFNVGKGRPPMDTIPEGLEEIARDVLSTTILGSTMGLSKK